MLEDQIMRGIVRIAHGARRRPKDEPREQRGKCRGFGHILDLLIGQDGLTQQQIADKMDIRPQSASEAISAMENQGLLIRKINEQDRRSCRIYITPAGRMQQAELSNMRMENAKRIFSPLTEDEKNTLLQLLEKVTAVIGDKEGM